MIWDRKIECASRDEMHKIQSTRLNAMVERIYKHVPFYTKKLDEKGIKPGDITDVSQLQYLPFTEKNDLRDNYPFGLFTVPQEEIVRIHASSG
ncbi:MAG TPA: phenylacetate--CoA ligase, partial [Bacteroidales bacterium]|nr:phenylacetate--CoA ligase [Bacteroidales bacterium]